MKLSSIWGGIASALAFVLAASVGDAAESGKASFDCTKAKSVAEKMICADPGLAAADAAIAANYAAALKRLDFSGPQGARPGPAGFRQLP